MWRPLRHAGGLRGRTCVVERLDHLLLPLLLGDDGPVVDDADGVAGAPILEDEIEKVALAHRLRDLGENEALAARPLDIEAHAAQVQGRGVSGRGRGRGRGRAVEADRMRLMPSLSV